MIGTARTYTGETGTTPVVPVPGPEWEALLGNRKPIGGIMHIFDPDDGNWYPETMRGVGDQRHMDIGSDSEGVPG